MHLQINLITKFYVEFLTMTKKVSKLNDFWFHQNIKHEKVHFKKKIRNLKIIIFGILH